MYESDLERTREYLKSRLPEYLRRHGINPEAPFHCLNPGHQDHLLSMRCSLRDYTVYCRECHAIYNIFDLVGMEYGLKDPKAQYQKTCELFLGTSSAAREAAPARSRQDSTAAAAGGRSDPAWAANHNQTPDDRRPVFTPLSSPATLQRSGSVPFAGGRSARPRPERSETQYNYADYLRAAAQNAGQTDFFRLHGLSEEVIRRFHLGFDAKLRTGNSAGDPVCWQAAVIPCSDYSFTACNTDPQARDQIRRIGLPAVFNEQALEQPGAIFITGSELDALSLETLGCPAVAAAGSRPGQLLDLLARSRSTPERMFYICLPEDAQDAGELEFLCDSLHQLGLPARRIDPAWPCSTINQALCRDRENFTWKIRHLQELLSCRMSPVQPDDEVYSFIENSAALSKLDLSPYIYCLCGRSHVLRRVLHLILEERLCRLITVTSQINWKFICRGLEDTAGSNDDPGARAVFTDQQPPEKLADTLRFVLTALRLQGGGSFAVAVDLTALEPALLRRLLPQLAALSTQLCTGLLLLCPAGTQELCEGTALQTIAVTQSEDGSELEFSSADLNCRRISFTRYAGL